MSGRRWRCEPADPSLLSLFMAAVSAAIACRASTGAVTGPSRHGAAHPAARFCL